MGHRFLEITGTPSVKAAQAAHGSRAIYAKFDGGAATHDRLGPAEADFIAARDSFYLASVSETGGPYIQHRGGPPGFIQVVDERHLRFPDYRGNRQYITLGNTAADPRVALFLMDYPNRSRLKLLGRLSVADGEDVGTAARAKVERYLVVEVEAFDWNCPQHITPRFTEAELVEALAPMRQRLDELEAENARLRRRLAGNGEERGS
ncbi:MAG: pyridoxamine 5'-phosphate oxidase family protein [Kofleriaceae bacterium]|nr:pyridoxamine 5'-phosphate oxidase family protein [Kofleriaceae bacterium]